MHRNDIPDIAKKELSFYPSSLKKVGMENINVPIRLQIEGLGPGFQMAKADAYVSLDQKKTRGIHMSRLFVTLQKSLESENLTFNLLKSILEKFRQSHSTLSKKAYLNLRYKLPLFKKSLISSHGSWQKYDIDIKSVLKENMFEVSVSVKVLYSSTCPCSAALARQLVQKKFKSSFQNKEAAELNTVHEWLGKEESIIATPHSQRSQALVTVYPHKGIDLSIENLIQRIEKAVCTPVQGIVKREDEQEFAHLNGKNLMFAEDACRRIKESLQNLSSLKDFEIKISHFESLHAHDAVAYAQKDCC